jgi:hypothetical protein
MNPHLPNLITAIVSEVTGRGSYVTKTKLLKLLYLFDVEYYRERRETFTGLNWKYFHLGPWTREYDPILDDLVGAGKLLREKSPRADHETEFYRTPAPVPINQALPIFSDENVLRVLLNAWAEKPTNEILNYVYFHTEPMIHGERDEILDFSLIAEERTPIYRRSSSGKTQKEIKDLRKKFEEQKKAAIDSEGKSTAFPQPRYDDEYWQAMEALEELAR